MLTQIEVNMNSQKIKIYKKVQKADPEQQKNLKEIFKIKVLLSAQSAWVCAQ